MIEVKNISQSYGKKQIIRDVSFTAGEGECIGIVGANGCGKSTLLGVLSGIIKPSMGEILYGGQNALKDGKIFSTYVGFVPQDNPLMEELTVYDNLKFWYCDTGRNLKEDIEQGLVKRFGLDGYLKMPVYKLSGGWKKRLSIVCALAGSPKVLILDEPGAALDIVLKEEIKECIKELKKEGTTIVLTSHEESELSVCDRKYLLKEGALQRLPGDITIQKLMELIRG
ncbi:MAG: ABC transporter ATP-binding protein [Lachnospiraceae bacterium]